MRLNKDKAVGLSVFHFWHTCPECGYVWINESFSQFCSGCGKSIEFYTPPKDEKLVLKELEDIIKRNKFEKTNCSDMNNGISYMPFAHTDFNKVAKMLGYSDNQIFKVQLQKDGILDKHFRLYRRYINLEYFKEGVGSWWPERHEITITDKGLEWLSEKYQQ